MLVAAGTPVVLVLVIGCSYAIGPVAGELAAAVQAFGHGLSYTTFAYSELAIERAKEAGPDGRVDGGADDPVDGSAEIATDGTAVISCTVRNTGARAGAEVVQLYLSDPVAQVVRPVHWLAGFARVLDTPAGIGPQPDMRPQ